MKTKGLLFTSLLATIGMQAQEYKNEIKGNILFAPLGIVNVGYERALSKHWSGQADIFISPWKSFSNNHLQVYMGHGEARYYFKEAMDRWYVGGNLGLGFFDIQKWNYWNTDKYQRGFSFMFGATVGYKFKIGKRLKMDIFLRGGSSQGSYHGWMKKGSPARYDSATSWNRSGEIIPFGGGAMLSYQF
ncbi:DUF3575 domain-containing protein [Elizabethkingia sp. JS20170427COW]|uniref:DUF3575 domain-containing protein n=1 Tax=Elizabethkingia sp. JS20170427COW TaxID=2583851 RepID=UPI001110EF77|nr:DUF3575 domain-containing protein [Elizabethkingia sp. JS20170427COW]QCX54258.1 DUF3575 domain-containing protein [Elizabethkingia sp. JS20170427COW]